MSHEATSTHPSQSPHTSRALSRRSFLRIAAGTLTALPTVVGGVLVATPTAAFATDGLEAQAATTDVLKLVALRANEVCVSVVDLTGGGKRAIVGARVKIISRYNDKTAEGTTGDNGVAVLRIAELAEKDARERTGMYTFRARIEVQAQGYRIFKTGLAEITGGNGFEAGTERLQAGVPYPSRVSFDDWDILYSNNEFGLWKFNTYDHKLEIEFEGVAQTPLKVRLTSNTDRTFVEGTTTPKGGRVTVSFGGRFLQEGHQQSLALGGNYLLQYNQGGVDYEVPLALVIRKGEGKMDDDPNKYKFYDFAPLSSVSKLLEFKIPDKISVIGGTKIRLLPSLSLPIMFTIDPISGIYGLSINITSLFTGKLTDDQGNPVYCDYWGYKTDKGAPDPKAWSSHPYKTFSSQMEKIKQGMSKDNKDLYAKMKANAQSGSKNQRKYGIGHVPGGGTLDHQFKVSVWLNNFIKWQEHDKVWQCLAGSIALNANFEVSFTKHFIFFYVPMFLVIAFSVDATFVQMALSWIAKELTSPSTWQWDWGTRSIFFTITPKLTLTLGAGIKGFVSVSVSGSLSITATIGWNFRAAPKELPPNAAGKPKRYTLSAGFKISLNVTLWLVSLDKTFDPWEAPNFIDNWRDSPSGMTAQDEEALGAMAEEFQSVSPLEYLSDPTVEYTVISEDALAELAEFTGDYDKIPAAAGGPEEGPRPIEETYDGTTHTLTSIALPLFTTFAEEEYEEYEEEYDGELEAEAETDEGAETEDEDVGAEDAQGAGTEGADAAAEGADAGTETAQDVAAAVPTEQVDATGEADSAAVAQDVVAATATTSDATREATAAAVVAETVADTSVEPQEQDTPGTEAATTVVPAPQEDGQDVQVPAQSPEVAGDKQPEQPAQDDTPSAQEDTLQAQADAPTRRYAKYDITRPYEFREVRSDVDAPGSEGGLKPKYDQVIIDNILADARVKIVDIEDTPHIFRIGVVMVNGQPRTRVICNQLDKSMGKYGIGTHVFDFPIQGLATGIGSEDDPAGTRDRLFDYDFDVIVDQRVNREKNAKYPVMGYINLVVVSGFRAEGTSTKLSTLAKDQIITYACYFFRRRVERERLYFGSSVVKVRRTREFEDVTSYSVRADSLSYTTTYDGQHQYHMICCPKLALVDPDYGRTFENDVVGFSPILCSFLDRAAERPDDLFNSDESSSGGATAIGIGLFFVSDHKINGSVQGKLAKYRKLFLDFEDPAYIVGSLGPIKDYSIYGMELSGKHVSEDAGHNRSQWHLLQLFGSAITHPIFIRVAWENVQQVPVISAIKKASLVSEGDPAAFEAAQLIPWKNGSYLATVNETIANEEREQLPAAGDRKSRLYRVDITDFEGDPKFVFKSVGLDTHAVQSFCIDTYGDTIFWPVMQDGAPVYDHDELGEGVATGKTKNYYAIMASEFYSSTGYLDDAEGFFCDPYVFAETSHRMDTLAISYRSPDVYDASNLRDTDVAFISTEVVDSKAGKGRIWYTSMPMVRSLTVIGVSAHCNTVIPGEDVNINIAVRNDGNQWLRACQATIRTKDGSTTLFDDMVLFDEDTLMESQWNVRQEDGTLSDNKYGYWLAPGRSALYRVTCRVPESWSGTNEIVARIQALQFDANNQLRLSASGLSAQAESTQPLEYLYVLDEEPTDYLETDDGEYGVETDELSQAPITVKGGSSGGNEATPVKAEVLPRTGDDTPFGGMGLGLGALGAAMLAYSKRRNDIAAEEAREE